MSLPDGSHVSLDAVVVDKIRARQCPAYFVARGFFDPKARLVVYTPPPSLLRYGQTVDVEGTISTLANGVRAILGPTVRGYLDKDGKLLYHGPLLKGLSGPATSS